MAYYTALKFFVYAMAIWRVTYLLGRDNGPFHIFDWLRYKLGVIVTEVEQTDGTYRTYKAYHGKFAELIDCLYCLSFWVTMSFLPGIVSQNPTVVYLWDMVATACALWAVATIISMIIVRE